MKTSRPPAWPGGSSWSPARVPAWASNWLTSQIPLGRGGYPGELDQSILFLLGPGSSFVTGHVLTVDGGMAVR
jgi:NAD(P)-dependent dehydrogenase (short-subunit alcohol dehydrogenase family)